MTNIIATFIQTLGQALELIGVLCIVFGFILATVAAGRRLLHASNRNHSLFRFYRHSLARSVLIGLEFLVAADIIRTVTGDLNLEGVAILAGIVLIRIVLGMTLEAELRDAPLFCGWRTHSKKSSR
ncbi:DUF1622 domain-containing protein [Candidatus Saccharibacteria bacterium]|nr:DUF1622 domain-containing protein [Candidatus Saccharibacteria bacterium]